MYIQVNIIKDRHGFYPDGCFRTVNCKSQLGPIQSIVTEESSSSCVDFGTLGDVAAFNAPGTTNALKIIDPIQGEMWAVFVGPTRDDIAATVANFGSACACCVGTGGGGTGTPAVPLEVEIGSPEADALGWQDGDTNIQNAGFADHNILFFRDFGLDGSIDMGDGTAFHTPKLLGSDNFDISQALQDGEHILILIL